MALAWPLPKGALGKQHATRVMEEEWDFMILLDACRFDMYREVVDSAADSCISGGSYTQEWLEFNFNRECKDVVYIAGNPHFASVHLKHVFGFNPFHHVEEVWDYGWSDDLKTVPPEAVTRAAVKCAHTYPDKRMIVHYNQPHHPFLGDQEITALEHGTWRTVEGMEGGLEQNVTTVWDLAWKNRISDDHLRAAYWQNLRLVMVEVNKLLEQLSGKVILTADHGNLLGEWGLYGHPASLRLESLVRVPWVMLKNGSRRAPTESARIRARIAALKQAGRV